MIMILRFIHLHLFYVNVNADMYHTYAVPSESRECQIACILLELWVIVS